MADRDRFIELFSPFADGTYNSSGIIIDGTKVDDIVDYLLANGVIVPPCKVGDYVRFKGLTALWRVDAVHYYREGMPQITVTLGKITNTIAYYCGYEIEVFAKEQAEEKLEELSNGTL